MNKYKYVSIDDCKNRLFKIALDFDESENTPSYNINSIGVGKLEGVLFRCRESWYGNLQSKAAFLFVSINKGHYFVNGNKRLALIVVLEFLYVNKVLFKNYEKEKYKKWIEANFPEYEIVDRSFVKNFGWAFYNLNKAVANSKENFGVLKKKVANFLDVFATF